jgi:hypothetical protein
MRWIAPYEKDTATASLENRLWAAADPFRAYLSARQDRLPFATGLRSAMRRRAGVLLGLVVLGCTRDNAAVEYRGPFNKSELRVQVLLADSGKVKLLFRTFDGDSLTYLDVKALGNCSIFSAKSWVCSDQQFQFRLKWLLDDGVLRYEVENRLLGDEKKSYSLKPVPL